ncbi:MULTISPECIES: hypothetical protein [Amycolatopsis]|uniref:preATP grasp domain-containing protein n=1 Tax=Amycolatopsis TaxID=1813 RepID=UPI000B8B4466|nr:MULTISPECIES: hypothetical protein [Amycolatopsis]OXM72802.1 hypothetical protein CF166_13320 [Amycolatopsis sp. KNN50.9b]
MRILVGNHIDGSIRQRKDMRSWTQRILWFARAGDLVVLPDYPDAEFLAYVTTLTGVDSATLRVHVPPSGPSGHHLLDLGRLEDPEFVRRVAVDLDEVTEVFPLWPSAQVARFARALGVHKWLPGYDFLYQGGGELVNSKANFRALAAAAGVPIAAGEVVRNVEEAAAAMTRLLADADAVVVKQAHNGAGSGNEVVSYGDIESAHAGTKHQHRLATGTDGVQEYWRQRWAWASAGGRFPVVVEEFRKQGRTIFAEYALDDDGVRFTESGALHYVNHWLSHQTVPLRGLPDQVYDRLLVGAGQLAETYRAVGYRGYMSPDAVLDERGEVIFTEVNSQVSGSAHLWDVLAHRVVDVQEEPQRSVVEYHWPKRWRVTSPSEFLAVADELGCLYDPRTRTGIILSTPFDTLRGLVFALAYDREEWRDEVHHALDKRLTRGAAR